MQACHGNTRAPAGIELLPLLKRQLSSASPPGPLTLLLFLCTVGADSQSDYVPINKLGLRFELWQDLEKPRTVFEVIEPMHEGAFLQLLTATAPPGRTPLRAQAELPLVYFFKGEGQAGGERIPKCACVQCPCGRCAGSHATRGSGMGWACRQAASRTSAFLLQLCPSRWLAVQAIFAHAAARHTIPTQSCLSSSHAPTPSGAC